MYVGLRELATKFGATVLWEDSSKYFGARAKVTLNGVTRYYTANPADNDFAYLSNSGKMYIDDNHFFGQWGIIHTEGELLAKLNKAVNNYKNKLQGIATAPYNSNEESMKVVLGYFDKIQCVANKYQIDAALIASILFQEIRFYNVLDEVDVLVALSFDYLERLEIYTNAPWYTQLFMGLPMPPVGMRTDSSTGIGQIFAKTAINAINWYNEKNGMSTHYDTTDWHDLALIWRLLKYDNEFNIDTVGLILTYNKEHYGATEREMLKRYNGLSNLAEKYADVTLEYYLAFSEYFKTL